MNSVEVTSVSSPQVTARPTPWPLPFWMRKLRAVMLALGAVLVLRVIFVEPFSVPTGSMAPHILGVHHETSCWNCGKTVRVGEPHAGMPARFFDVPCPNCGARHLDLADQPTRAGDRLLVDKSTFGWRDPRRWELAVFRGPTEPDKPYVKRIVGLGNETIAIRDGDVYVNNELARKTLRQAQAVSVPVCQMNHVPKDGWAIRWFASPGDDAPRTDAAEIVFPPSTADAWREIHYQGENDRPIDDVLTYNGRRPDLPADWVHDFLVECEIVVNSGDGAIVIALNDGGNNAVVTLSPTDSARLTAGEMTRAANDRRLRHGATHRLELAFVDRCATARLDGAAIGEPIDLPVLVGRTPVIQPVRIRVRQLAATIRNLHLSRDLHYTSRGLLGNDRFMLGPDEYFMLGDNTDNSEDSRFWPKPGVQARDLIGKPFFVYTATDWREGVIFGRAWWSKSSTDDRFGFIH